MEKLDAGEREDVAAAASAKWGVLAFLRWQPVYG